MKTLPFPCFPVEYPERERVYFQSYAVSGLERISTAAREKQSVTYQGAPIRLSAGFPTETLQVRRDWQVIFKVMKSKDL